MAMAFCLLRLAGHNHRNGSANRLEIENRGIAVESATEPVLKGGDVATAPHSP
jgi:hypothetical protein